MVVLAVAALLAAGAIDRAVTLDQERVSAAAELQQLNRTVREAHMRTDYLEDTLETAERRFAEQDAVLKVRPAFVAEIAAFSRALTAAEGTVDTSTYRSAALSAQRTVLAERRDPAVVVAATATVRALTAKIGSDVSRQRAPQNVATGAPERSSSGADGYARVRAALDRVGGAGVGLYESGSCAGGTAPACANSDGYIKYRADVAGWSTSRLNWAMAHELAHIYQFRVWSSMVSSSSYTSMFGGDPEFLANCMALVRGYGGSVGCDREQQAWASGIWVGTVR